MRDRIGDTVLIYTIGKPETARAGVVIAVEGRADGGWISTIRRPDGSTERLPHAPEVLGSGTGTLVEQPTLW